MLEKQEPVLRLGPGQREILGPHLFYFLWGGQKHFVSEMPFQETGTQFFYPLQHYYSSKSKKSPANEFLDKKSQGWKNCLVNL